MSDGPIPHIPEPPKIRPVDIDGQMRDAYLDYAMSVIVARALPDARDGLKPVHRRILYAMYDMGIRASSSHKKSARIVGEVLGKYHPHGDVAVYDAMARMAQDFSLRYMLIDGQGNFGSVDGDPPAAMRYTEAKLARTAEEILLDIDKDTVSFSDNFDGSLQEPDVLPARFPNLLLNGTSGIAVGMATNIPPHNLKEVCNALLKLIRDPEIKSYQLVAKDAVQGPDFPTGGQIVNTTEELREIYETGQGTIKLRGTAKLVSAAEAGGKRGEPTAGDVLQITSIPFTVNKALMVERISELVYSGKLPLIEEVRDVSTDEIRIDLILKKGADQGKVLAYLFKHTQLQTNFNVNLTCLVPTERPEVGTPVRLGLKEILWHFLHFRLEC